MSTVPSPDAIVHGVALFLLHPPHPEAPGRGEWERARAAIAHLANSPCAAASPPPTPPPPSLPSNLVRFQRRKE
jgi:hypothetical protein